MQHPTCPRCRSFALGLPLDDAALSEAIVASGGVTNRYHDHVAPDMPSNAAVRRACESIEAGDFEIARNELGAARGYSLTPPQAADLRWSLTRAAGRFSKPELATRDVLAI